MTQSKTNGLRLGQRQGGITLLEVLVAVVVFSLGIIGLALMQIQGLQFTKDSNSRTQATILARDLADRMRANNEGANDGNYTFGATAAIPSSVTCDATSPCTPATLAGKDRYDWMTRVRAELPVGAGEVVALGSNQFSVRVFWDEDGTNTGTPTAGASDCSTTGWQCYELLVVMEG